MYCPGSMPLDAHTSAIIIHGAQATSADACVTSLSHLPHPLHAAKLLHHPLSRVRRRNTCLYDCVEAESHRLWKSRQTSRFIWGVVRNEEGRCLLLQMCVCGGGVQSINVCRDALVLHTAMTPTLCFIHRSCTSMKHLERITHADG